MRGATSAVKVVRLLMSISIHTPHAGSDSVLHLMRRAFPISIHTPHAGSDHNNHLYSCYCLQFQSTLPMRGATETKKKTLKLSLISIHTPHAGSDCFCSNGTATSNWISIHTPHAGSDFGIIRFGQFFPNFNPHSPCGERPSSCFLWASSSKFQSTLPMRGATVG